MNLLKRFGYFTLLSMSLFLYDFTYHHILSCSRVLYVSCVSLSMIFLMPILFLKDEKFDYKEHLLNPMFLFMCASCLLAVFCMSYFDKHFCLLEIVIRGLSLLVVLVLSRIIIFRD